ncbi:MAG: SdpI family protein [Oscillospiraceae bacterium]|nr:SdpI family protein [Oscillospiraceae bacterium]
MKLKKTDYIAILVLIATLIHLVVVYPSLPPQIPTNWGFDGHVDYGSKSTIWILYGISVAMFPLFFIIPKIDPKGKNYSRFEGFYSVFRLVIVLFLSGLLEMIIFSVQDAHRFDVSKISVLALSALMVFIGNYMPKCKHNYTMGIKTMWTIADERVWNDTHRFGGILFVIVGVIGFVATLFMQEKWYTAVSCASILAAIVVTTVYSYLSYKKYNG